ncbi:MAG: hypothetical protein ACOCRZ_00730 [Halothermotrichaceae bacterium]
MEEKPTVTDSSSVNGNEFFLFLILILLIMSNQGSFNNHFELFDKQVNKINNLLETLSLTTDGLKSAIAAPQKVKDNVDFQ